MKSNFVQTFSHVAVDGFLPNSDPVFSAVRRRSSEIVPTVQKVLRLGQLTATTDRDTKQINSIDTSSGWRVTILHNSIDF